VDEEFCKSEDVEVLPAVTDVGGGDGGNFSNDGTMDDDEETEESEDERDEDGLVPVVKCVDYIMIPDDKDPEVRICRFCS
jgi:hypothetical protein